jgi:osmotically-inducible protein OsmY
MNIKKLLVILISVLMLSVTLTACGSSSDSSSGQTPAGNSQAPAASSEKANSDAPSAQTLAENSAQDSSNADGAKLEELKSLYNTLVTIHNGSTTLVNQCQNNGVEVSDEMIETINSIKADLDVYRERLAADDAANTLDLDSEIAKIGEDIDAVRALNAAISSRLEELGLEVEYVEVQ